MKPYRTILMAAAFVLAISTAAVAQYEGDDPAMTTPAAQRLTTVTGTVVSVSPASLVVKLAGGDQMIFAKDASSMVPSTLAEGATVRVSYDVPEPGTFHASSVTIDTAAPNADSKTDAASATSPAQPAMSAADLTENAGQTSPGSEAMPRTASPLAAIGLLGLLALGAGLTIRLLRG